MLDFLLPTTPFLSDSFTEYNSALCLFIFLADIQLEAYKPFIKT